MHINTLEPRKKPFHTLNPAMAQLADNGTTVYGTMGGDGQPQTQATIFNRVTRFGDHPQQAIERPRWLLGRTWGQSSDSLKLESRFDPGLIFFLAGADPHEGDRLGRLRLSFDGLQARDRRVFDWAWQRRAALAFVMAGGYGHDLESTVQVQLNTWSIALEYWRRWASLRQA